MCMTACEKKERYHSIIKVPYIPSRVFSAGVLQEVALAVVADAGDVALRP
jgi:hypothetical protein